MGSETVNRKARMPASRMQIICGVSIMIIVALTTCYLRALAVSKEEAVAPSCKAACLSVWCSCYLTTTLRRRSRQGSTFFVDASRRAAEKTMRTKRRDVRVILVRHGQSMANVRPNLIGGRQNTVFLSPTVPRSLSRL